MANEQKQSIDTDVKEGEINQPEPSAKKSLPLWIALVVVLLASIGLSGWLYQQQRQQQDQSQVELTQLQTERQSLLSQLERTQNQLAELQTSQQSLSTAVGELTARQQSPTDDVMTQWQLREVEFLLNIANQRAVLAKDVVGAMQALQMADSKIKQLDDFQLHPLQEKIAEEMAALQAVAKVDVAAIGIQLQTAINRVDNLRVVNGPQTDSSSAQNQNADDEASSRWQQAAADIWQQVRSLVVIRHNENSDNAVLVPEQRYFLYQNLKLQLESARLSLLKADEAGYKHSLATAVEWLNQYFVGDERDAMLASLTALQDKSIVINIPDISGSLKWLKEFQQ